MPPKTNRKNRSTFSSRAVPFGYQALGAALVSVAVISAAQAAGLGKLTVLSSLGQPLHAEIELTSVSREEANSISVRLASADAYRQANIDFNPALYSLRFAIEQRGSQQIVRVTSAQPMNEPFVDMLLEVGGAGSRLVREYTFLLDPPELRKPQAALAAAPAARPLPAPAAAPQAAPRAPAAPAVPARLPAAASAPQRAPAAPDSVEVKHGDTLGSIARQVKPAGISLDQMLVALQRSNPDAFAGQNMNRLRAGQILQVPDAQAARGVAPGEARRIVVAQAKDFNEYRNKLAAQAAGRSGDAPEGGQLAGGRITARVEEPANPANESLDRLKLSRSGAAPAAEEERIAQEKALAEANARIKELERNLSDLQKLLELKSQGMAERQQQAAAAANPAAAPAEAVAQAPAATDSAVADAAAAASSAPAAPQAAKPAPKPAPKPVQPAAPEPGLLDGLLDNPLVLGLGALIAALAGAVGIRRLNQRRKEEDVENSSLLAESALKTNSLFGSTGGQTVDTSNSMFNSSFSPSASQLDTNEVDPVAEADVYIAYGRDAQAEEILKEALRTQPERDAVRAKLLEIYANRKDVGAFGALATELYGRTGGKGEEWQQTVALGAALDPENPLYADGKAALAAAAAAPADELDLDALLNTTRALGGEEEKAAPAPAAGATVAEPVAGMDMVPAMPATPAQPAESAQAAGPADPVSADQPSAADNSLDFDFELPSLDAKAGQAEAAEPAASAEADPNLLDFDFGKLLGEARAESPAMPAEPLQSVQATPSAEAPAASPEPEDELPVLSLAPEAEAAAPGAEEEPALEFDLSGLNLDLPALQASLDAPTSIGGLELEAQTAAAPEAEAAEVVDMAGGSQANFTEMATKLDLALAYREIGDQEGARELLDEVVKGGNAEQSEKARALLLELA